MTEHAYGDQVEAGATPSRLPTVVVTSVIRSTYQGQSHGGVYVVDLEQGHAEQVLDWDDAGISWEGRGGDRGLRGIAFWQDAIYLAASDEVFVYSQDWERIGSFTNPYLKHCHEIDVDGDTLLLSSCGFDAVLEFDLQSQQFSMGHALRPGPVSRLLNRAAPGRLAQRPTYTRFDPVAPDGPMPRDTCHINSVSGSQGTIFFCGTRLDRLYQIDGKGLSSYARVPAGTHNAKPFGDLVLMNDTASDRIAVRERNGNLRRQFPVLAYDPEALEQTDLARGNARQAFGRGLTTWEDRYLISGSSPATVSVHDLETGELVSRVNLTMDVRNAVHGLEIWPS